MRWATLSKVILCILCWLGSSGAALGAAPAASYRILYLKDGQLWTMAPDGSDQGALTHGQPPKNSPLPSPDGSYIAFVALASQPTDYAYEPGLYVIDAYGHQETALVLAKDERITGADWSPDGQRLVFASYPGQSNDHSELYIINRDGSNRVQLTDDRVPSEQGAVHNTDPRWSPDGRTILFSSGTGEPNLSLYTASADGKSLAKVVSDLHAFVAGPDPRWSGDGKSIVFLNYPDLFVMAADGSQVRQITHFATVYDSVYAVTYARYGAPSYALSPDGGQVLTTFGYGADGVEIMVIGLAPGGWEARRVLHADYNLLRNAFWSPDGQWIYFERDQSDGITIYRMRVDGTSVTPLAKGSGATVIRLTTN